MRRIVGPSRVIYVNRNRERSLLLLFGAVMAGLLAATAWERRATDSSALPFMGSWLAISGGLLTGAVLLLLRQRAFIVDQAAGTMQILDRRLTGKNLLSVPLREVGVRVSRKFVDCAASRSMTTIKATGPGWAESKMTTRIWIELSGRDDVLFLDDVVGREGEDLARRLASDLRSSMKIENL